MTAKREKLIHLICGIAVSLAVIAAGICLVAACVEIYMAGGDDPFTREIVGAALSAIAPALYIAVAAVAVGGICTLGHCITEKNKPLPEHRVAWERAKAVATEPDEETVALCEKEEKSRNIWRIVSLSLLAVAALASVLIFVFAQYGENINAAVGRATLILLPVLCVAGAVGYLFDYRQEASYKTETAALRAAARGNRGQKPAVAKESRARLWAVRGAVLGLGILFVLLGIFNGGMQDVLVKAVNICTECIGLG